MAVVSFNRKEIEKELKINSQIIEKIQLMGIPIEEKGEDILIEVLPNRPDLFSQQGFLRSVKSFLGKEKKFKNYSSKNPNDKQYIEVNNSVNEIRPFVVGAVINNIKLDDEKIKSLIDLQEKIHNTLGRNRKKIAIGIYPLNKISFPITYEALNPEEIKFRALDSEEEMNSKEILKYHQKGKEYSHLLEKSNKYPVFIDSNKKILSMPPIINSHDTGKVSINTKDLFIECTGTEINSLKKCLNIIVTTCIDMGGSCVALKVINKKNKTQIITPNLKTERIKINKEKVEKIIGLKFSEKDLNNSLVKMGYEYEKGNVTIPCWRTDINNEIDIIEDIAIGYGYENITPQISEIPSIAEESKEEIFMSQIKESLLSLGLLEIKSYHLIKKEESEKLLDEEKIEVESSKTDYKFLRPNLIIPALRTLSNNKDNEYPQKIFEIGTIFKKDRKDKTETGIYESKSLCIALTPSNSTEMKQFLDYLGKMFSYKFDIEDYNSKYLIEGRTISIILNKKVIGILGEVHPNTLKEYGLKMPVSIMEININGLIKNYPK